MTKFLKYFLFFAVVALAFTALDASASAMGNTNNVFDIVVTRMTQTFKNVRAVIFIIGGFGLVGLGFAAIFGKVRWAWLGALAAGLAIVAEAGAVDDYVTRSSSQSVADVQSFDDTLSQ